MNEIGCAGSHVGIPQVDEVFGGAGADVVGRFAIRLREGTVVAGADAVAVLYTSQLVALNRDMAAEGFLG